MDDGLLGQVGHADKGARNMFGTAADQLEALGDGLLKAVTGTHPMDLDRRKSAT